MRYLFIGSSDYGLPALNKLRQNGYEPSLIISQPAKPAGRNLHLTPTPVSQYAIEQKLPLFTP
ncbi:MAG: methionyl-tRNA formyltransferase, partial [Candidatus Cloacimonas acidaminovorans]